MVELTKAHEELYRREPDEAYATLDELHDLCRHEREWSQDLWKPPQDLVLTHDMTLALEENPDFRLNDWSFSQVCRMAGVSKDTLNRLSHKTASKALEETLPRGGKPLQILATSDLVRSVHGVAYTRLWNTELLDVVREAADGFEPPQQASGGGTGLYCGEQDLFCFLIDPLGWIEVDGESFAPGLFVWNSEVGRRSLGIQTFWFQAVCQNHIVWDAVEVVEFSRKHTANVRDGLHEIRDIIRSLVAKRDQRRDKFARVLEQAMRERLGDDADEALKTLIGNGIPRNLARQALELAQEQGRFTIFSVVDVLTRHSQSIRFAGDRTELDLKVGRLLTLVA